MGTHDSDNLIKGLTCLEGVNSICIDLMLTNPNQHLMKFTNCITGMLASHALTTSILKLKTTRKLKFVELKIKFNEALFQVNFENSLRNVTDSTNTSFEEKRKF